MTTPDPTTADIAADTATGSPEEAAAVLGAGPPVRAREEQLVAGADSLVGGGRTSIVAHPRFLLGAAATLMTLGVSLVLLGWFGAAKSTLVEEQIPYLISGGLLGVALSTIGALLFFTHWLTVAIKEDRAREAARRQDHTELMTALTSLSRALQQGGGENGTARSPRAGRPVRRAPRGS